MATTVRGQATRRWWLFWRGRRQRRRSELLDPWRRFRRGLELLAAVLVLGTLGYRLIGLPTFDAFYQTAITITTVGYGEIGPPAEVDTAYRAFTLVLVLIGASSALYTISVLLETLVEGSLNDGLRRRRMLRKIDHLHGHVIVVGWGRVGRSIATYVARMGTKVVVVDRVLHPEEPHVSVVVGEATDDDVLFAAGLERASVLIAALDGDADNLYVTLTARAARPDLFVVVRTSTQANEKKFFQAGANRVVNPHEIGGSRMGAVAMQPNVAEFLDEVLHDEDHDVSIQEIAVTASSAPAGGNVGALRGDGALVIAVRKAESGYIANPPGATALDVGDVVIALGSGRQVNRLRHDLAPARSVLHPRGQRIEIDRTDR